MSSSNFPFNNQSNSPSRKPEAHRCNDYLEDVLKGLSTWPMDVAGPFQTFLECMKSAPGEEPPLYSTTKKTEESKKD